MPQQADACAAETVDLKDVRLGELKRIAKRREEADVPVPGLDDDRELKDDLVGLSLSGGGIRSSCFNLGVLQALHKSGLIRFVDYLSTVSGGGYVGTHHSSAVHSQKKCISKDEFPFREENEGHKQPARLRHFIYNGEYLNKPVLLANRYLIGVLWNNVAVFSGMVAACALVALLWRCLDYPWFRDRAALLDLSRDLYAPFFPTLFFALWWLIAWALSYYRRSSEASGKWARRLLVATLASFLVGCALLIGNGNITLGTVGDWVGIQQTSISPVIWGPVVPAVLVGLVPFLRPSRLIKSGTRPEHSWERVVFSASSAALLIGIPLVLVGVIGRENVSGYATHPDRDLRPEEVEDWARMEGFLHEVHQSQFLGDKAFSDFTLSTTPSVRDSFTADLDAFHTIASNRDDAYFDILFAQERGFEKGNPRYETVRFDDYLHRTGNVLAWFVSLDDDDDVARYWRLKTDVETEQAALMRLVNQTLLPSRKLTSFLLARWDGKKQNGVIPNAGDTHAVTARTNGAPVIESGDSSISLASADKPRVPGIGMIDVEEIRRRYDGDQSKTAQTPPHVISHDNRKLLAVAYPDMIRPPSDIRRRVVIYEDQWRRLQILGVALGVFLLAGVWVNMSATSLHRFYKRQLERAYIWGVRWGQPDEIPLSTLNTTDYGAPYHLLCASVSMFKKRFNEDESETVHGIAEASGDKDPRWIDTFLFSQEFCGSRLTGYVNTGDYEECIRGGSDSHKFTLSDAMALSGAAFTPTQSRNWLVAFLMLILNLRLGQWLPNPRRRKPKMRPRFLSLAWNLWKPAEKRAHCFVTDGGHSENLGLVELLKRRCRLIIASDAGHDPEHQFDDLARAVRSARIHGGVRIAPVNQGPSTREVLSTEPLDLKTMEHQDTAAGRVASPDKRELPQCDEHMLIARILYYEDELDAPDGQPTPGKPVAEGVLVYLKPSFTGDEGLDLEAYRRTNPKFPHQPTSDQMFDDAQVESYRQLGYHIGRRLYERLGVKERDVWDGPVFKVADLCQKLCKAEEMRQTPPDEKPQKAARPKQAKKRAATKTTKRRAR